MVLHSHLHQKATPDRNTSVTFYYVSQSHLRHFTGLSELCRFQHIPQHIPPHCTHYPQPHTTPHHTTSLSSTHFTILHLITISHLTTLTQPSLHNHLPHCHHYFTTTLTPLYIPPTTLHHQQQHHASLTTLTASKHTCNMKVSAKILTRKQTFFSTFANHLFTRLGKQNLGLYTTQAGTFFRWLVVGGWGLVVGGSRC